jgi:hypothetical protein
MCASHRRPEQTLSAKDSGADRQLPNGLQPPLHGSEIEGRRYAEMSQDELSTDFTRLLIVVNNDEGLTTIAPVPTLLTFKQ